MANPTQKLEIWWEGLQPRERKLVAMLGVTAIVCVVGFAGLMVRNGLDGIETRNAQAREALAELHKHRLAKARGISEEKKQVQVPDEASKIDLESYLEKASKDVGVSFPKYNRGTAADGAFERETGRIELKDVNIAEMSAFLQSIESNPLVVVQELRVKRDFRDNDKLDVPEIMVATWYSKSAAASGETEEKK